MANTLIRVLRFNDPEQRAITTCSNEVEYESR